MPRITGSQSTRIFQWMLQQNSFFDLMPPTKGQIVKHFTNALGGFKFLMLRVFQVNDLALPKQITLTGAIDGLAVVFSESVPSGVSEYLYPEISMGTGAVIGFAMVSVEQLCAYFKTECFVCHNVDLGVKFDDTPGTNQEMATLVAYLTWSQV